MKVPRQFRKEPAMKFSTTEVRYTKAGCYSSFDDIMDAIKRNATGNSKGKIFFFAKHPGEQRRTKSVNRNFLKVDKATQELRVNYYGKMEKHGLLI